MNIAGMRREILIRYPGWMTINRMPENQIVAIYKSMQQRGDFDGRHSRSGRELGYLVEKEEQDDGYHQITISEYLAK